MSTKQIRVIRPDGTGHVLDFAPTSAMLGEIVGGYIEIVQCLDRVEDGKGVYCPMVINEEGLLMDLPRNEEATKLYQNNVRTRYAGHPNPFEQARLDHEAEMQERGFVVIDGNKHLPNWNPDDPAIVGTVVYFQGYTVEEMDDAITEAGKVDADAEGRDD